jgi:hypothetical protein
MLESTLHACLAKESRDGVGIAFAPHELDRDLAVDAAVMR